MSKSKPHIERRLALVSDPPCEHLHETTSRYDPAAKRLIFLLVCRKCRTEKVVEIVRYEPRYEPDPPRLAA